LQVPNLKKINLSLSSSQLASSQLELDLRTALRRPGLESRQVVRFLGKHSNAVVKIDLICIADVIYNEK
jgi:hypothetical protein